MNILFISNFYPPHHIGGYEMLCQEVATHLQARGHQVTVLTSNYDVSGAEPSEPGIYRQLTIESDIYYYHPQRVMRYWFDRRAQRQTVAAVMAATQPDVVVIWGMWNLSTGVARQIEEMVGSRVVYYLANLWPAEPSAHEAYWSGTASSLAGRLFKTVLRGPVRRMLRHEWRPYGLEFKHVIACSRSVRDELVTAGVPVGGAKILYHGIDPMPYRTARQTQPPNHHADSLRAVYVGSLVAHKGVHTAIEAFGRWLQADSNVHATLAVLGAGHPEYEERLHNLVTEWHLEDKVTFHRPIPRSELPGFLAQFDVLLMPSVWEEPQARISQEAMAAGLVLVATLTGGTKEILVDGQNGLGFPPEDAQTLAQHLQRLARDPELRSRLIRAGWETVSERFTITRMMDELESYLANVAAK